MQKHEEWRKMKISIDAKKSNKDTANESGMSSKQVIIKTIAYPLLIPFKMGAVILQGMYFFAGWLMIAVGYSCNYF